MPPNGDLAMTGVLLRSHLARDRDAVRQADAQPVLRPCGRCLSHADPSGGIDDALSIDTSESRAAADFDAMMAMIVKHQKAKQVDWRVFSGCRGDALLMKSLDRCVAARRQ